MIRFRNKYLMHYMEVGDKWFHEVEQSADNPALQQQRICASARYLCNVQGFPGDFVTSQCLGGVTVERIF